VVNCGPNAKFWGIKKEVHIFALAPQLTVFCQTLRMLTSYAWLLLIRAKLKIKNNVTVPTQQQAYDA